MSQVVVGGSIAALVAADRLAHDGVDVELLLPSRGVGGGFAAHEVGDHRVELGSRLLELSYGTGSEEPAPDPATYQPGPHGHRPFMPLVEAFIRDLAGDDLQPVSPALVESGGERVRDWVFDGDLTGVVELLDRDPEALSRIQREVGANYDESRRRGFGERGLFADPHGLAAASLLAASRAHAGRTFHERFVEPFASRIIDGGSAGVAADLHRKIWMPLFWPGTLAGVLRDGETYQPDRPMHTLRNGGVALLVERLIERVTNHPRVTVRRHGGLAGLEADHGATRLQMADGAVVLAALPILAVAPDELFGAVGGSYSPHRVTSTMCWLELADHAVPDTLWLLDPERPVFRVSRNQADGGSTVACCELAWWVRAEEIEELAKAELANSGIIEHSDQASVLTIARVESFAAPSPSNRRRFHAAQEAFQHLDLDVIVAGGAIEFGADTLNEQIAQGIVSAAKATARSAVVARA